MSVNVVAGVFVVTYLSLIMRLDGLDDLNLEDFCFSVQVFDGCCFVSTCKNP